MKLKLTVFAIAVLLVVGLVRPKKVEATYNVCHYVPQLCATPTPVATASPTPVVTSSPTSSPTASASPTWTSEPTNSPESTPSGSIEPTSTPEPTQASSPVCPESYHLNLQGTTCIQFSQPGVQQDGFIPLFPGESVKAGANK